VADLLRTFVAVPVARPEVVEALRRAQDSLRHTGGIAWVKPALFHFTLRFLGEISGERVEAARAALAGLAGNGAFDLSLANLGTFPPERPARVVWAGCGEGADALVSLAVRVEGALDAAGFPREERPFSPHLTLGRVRDPYAGREVARRVAQAPPVAFGTLRVNEVVLMKSVLSPAGPAYSPVSVAKL
jgi:2'-5' RNA ligase